VQTWYRETMSSRAVSLAHLAKVIIMQRLHEDDLSGVALAEGGYTHLCLPNRFSTTSTKTISLPSQTPWGGDRRTVEGELLCPGRVDDATDTRQRVAIGSHAYAAQYDQRPANSDGNIIKRAWLGKVWTVLPAGGRYIQSWDMAFKATDVASFVVGQVWYYKDGEYFLVDQVREQMGFSATVQAVITLTAKHPKALAKIVEAKANGPAVVDMLGKKVSGLTLVEPEGGKEARLQAISPLFEAGNVYLPDPSMAPWVHDYIEELATFPGAAKDDQVDCTSQALLHLSLKSTNLKAAMARMRAEGQI
jgi:predicted phage terminase large subunit-like protein